MVAHAWTQHMALLAGGQRVRQLVLAARPPGAGDAGTGLFVFHVRALDLLCCLLCAWHMANWKSSCLLAAHTGVQYLDACQHQLVFVANAGA